MKISTRLQLQTIVAVVAFAAILLIAFIQLGRINDKSAVIAEDVVPSVELLGSASFNFVQQRAALLSLMSADSAASQDSILAAYQRYHDEVQRNLQAYEAVVSDDADKALLAQLRDGIARNNRPTHK